MNQNEAREQYRTRKNHVTNSNLITLQNERATHKQRRRHIQVLMMVFGCCWYYCHFIEQINFFFSVSVRRSSHGHLYICTLVPLSIYYKKFFRFFNWFCLIDWSICSPKQQIWTISNRAQVPIVHLHVRYFPKTIDSSISMMICVAFVCLFICLFVMPVFVWNFGNDKSKCDENTNNK